MRFATRYLRVSGRLGLLAALLLAGTFALARESRPAQAAGTEIWLGSSSSCSGLALTSTVLLIGGPSTNVYVCVKNISPKDTFGAAAFNLDFSYVSWLLAVQSATLDSVSPALAKQWLGTTGRVVSCLPVLIEPNPVTGAGRVYGGCQTLEPPPPNGPTANTALAKITLGSGITKRTTPIDFRVGSYTAGSFLVSANFTGGISTASPIPSTVPVLSATIAPCADFTGAGGVPNNQVTLVDILYESGKFGSNSSTPGWNPNWDMDGNNFVNIQDIFIVAREYGMFCT